MLQGRLFRPFAGCFALALTIACGCAQKAENESAPSAQRKASPSNDGYESVALPPDASPADVVHALLKSLKDGDQKQTAALLTERALEETSRNKFSLSNVAAPSLSCSIKKAEYPDSQTAHVDSVWTDGEGEDAETFEIVWVLRKTTAGWRISGMGTPIFPTEPLVWFNFEDGEDFVRQLEQTDEEVDRRESAQAERQATRPTTNGNGRPPR
jgi:hypothetical protein